MWPKKTSEPPPDIRAVGAEETLGVIEQYTVKTRSSVILTAEA